LDSSDEELAGYEEVVGRFGEASEPEIRVQVARTLLNKGVTLGQLQRSDEALPVYEEVVARFGEASEPEIPARVAEALNSIGFEFLCRAKASWKPDKAGF
jgi:hypothetical protein